VRVTVLQISYSVKTAIFCRRAVHRMYEDFISEVFREINEKKENIM
jgi:hypothetical protein